MNEQLKDMTAKVAKGLMTRREFVGRAAALGVTAAVANAMLAGTARAQEPKKGGDLKLGSIGGESTNSLDPALAASQVPYANLYHFAETLVEVAPDGSIENRLAESYEASADAKTWMFKIRKGVQFHNGKELTPEDVMRTMERHSNEDSQSGALGILRDFDSMKVDGDTFSLTLKTANADLPALMADYHLMIQPDGGFDNPASGVGTGPFILESDEPGVRHLFRRNPDYWDPARGHVDSSEVLVLNDTTARTAALQAGQVHIANRIDPKVAALLGRAPNITIRNASGPGHYVFIMHVTSAPFDNNELRLALKYAIDRADMVDKILRGYGSIGNDSPINVSYPLFTEMEQRNYDPEKAREHYAKSGHDGSPIILRVSDVAFPGAIDAAQLFQQTAQAAGIPLELKREPGDGYWSEVWNKQPFCASYWGGRATQDQMWSTAYLSTADWNDTRWKREDFDRMLIEARGELDTEKRTAIYAEMGQMVRDEGGLICPMFNDFVNGVSTQVQGWIEDPTGDMMSGTYSGKVWLDT